MRRGVSIAAALTAALAVPATATAQTPCTFPKGWYTATAQLEYELSREAGLSVARIQRHVPPPGSTVDTAAFVRGLPGNVTSIGVGTVESGLYATAGVAVFAVNMANATASEPPSCGGPLRKKKR